MILQNEIAAIIFGLSACLTGDWNGSRNQKMLVPSQN